MKRLTIFAIAAALGLAAFWLQHEFNRGSFDRVEKAFAGWLAANRNAGPPLPVLVLVLYDEESSALAGTGRMGVLDGALFARAAARLGAVAAGVEGLSENPARMLEAAGRMPVFGGFEASAPPDSGWTPGGGTVGAGWTELPGLTGAAPLRFPRGFFLPPSGLSGPRRAALIARVSDQPVPSFLALAWAAGQGKMPSDLTAAPGRLAFGKRFLPLHADGSVSFFPEEAVRVISLNELLVEAEKFEREGGDSPMRGSIVVLCRATPDVARLAGGSDGAARTPAELWAQAWPAMQRGGVFVAPGWWYPPLVALAGVLLSLLSARGTWRAGAACFAAAFFIYLLAALGVFSSFGLLLPFVPTVATLLAGLFLGRIGAQRQGPVAP